MPILPILPILLQVQRPILLQMPILQVQVPIVWLLPFMRLPVVLRLQDSRVSQV